MVRQPSRERSNDNRNKQEQRDNESASIARNGKPEVTDSAEASGRKPVRKKAAKKTVRKKAGATGESAAAAPADSELGRAHV